jgi:hypothetical protein
MLLGGLRVDLRKYFGKFFRPMARTGHPVAGARAPHLSALTCSTGGEEPAREPLAEPAKRLCLALRLLGLALAWLLCLAALLLCFAALLGCFAWF